MREGHRGGVGGALLLAVITSTLASCSKPRGPVEAATSPSPSSAPSATGAASSRPPISFLRDGGVIADDPRPSGPDAMTKTAATPGLHVVDASAVKTSPSYDMAAARASTVPPTVSFRLDGPPVGKGLGPWKRVTLNGLLENSGTAAVTVTVFPAGPLGFYAEPSHTSAQRKPLPPGMPPLPMQAPPPPLIIELPARTAVRVTTDVALDDYDWAPGVPREIEWSFLFWNEPKPKGKVSVP